MTKYKYKSFHLDEKAHLDDLVADAVEVRRDELVRVLDHVDEDLYLGLDFVQIRRIRPKQQFHLLLLGLLDVTEKEQKVKIKFDNSDLLALLSVRVSEIEAEHVLVVPKEVSNDLKF